MNHTVCKFITTETAHRLLQYRGKCAHVHGHSYKWVCEVGAPQLQAGFVLDFSELKSFMVEYIEKRYDHALVLWDKDPLSLCTRHLAPPDDTCIPRLVVHPFNPTAENLALHVGKQIEESLIGWSASIRLVSLTVHETGTSFATYRASRV
jgi:6-pyruvoyltetrahydropterin/6-carboxytetrahydropterin synthase